jgi:uncharacterized membrane protein
MHLDDNRMELIMGRLLQVGVLAAGALMLVGGAYYLMQHGAQIADYRTFHAVVPERAQMIMWAAVVLMIATPVLRVAFAVLAFAAERDWLYTGISLVVLGLLAYGLFG